MHITHICLNQYSDGWSYQENLLAKYHKRLGHQVTVITSMNCLKEGATVKDDKHEFIDVNGVRVIRLETKTEGFLGRVPVFRDFYETLRKTDPDIIFLHGLQFKDSTNVARYIRDYPNVALFVDNHADFSNSATNFVSKNILHKLLWKRQAKKLTLYTKKFWGVMPSRVDFLQDVYHIPKEKTDLLMMGADNDLVQQSGTPERMKETRDKFGIKDDDFVIVTGGKIDLPKKQTLLLMDAVSQIENEHVKLLLFGSFVPELQTAAQEKFQNCNRLINAGWATTEQAYDYLAIADVAVFPGRHSVLWEQAAGQGIPLIVKFWKGTTHIDVCNNALFLTTDSVSAIKKNIEYFIKDPHIYQEMHKNAEKAQKHFLYEDIAKRSIAL